MIESQGGNSESPKARFLKTLSGMLERMNPQQRAEFRHLILETLDRTEDTIRLRREKLASSLKVPTEWTLEFGGPLETANKTLERVQWVTEVLREQGVKGGMVLGRGDSFRFDYNGYTVEIDIYGKYSRGNYSAWFLPISAAIETGFRGRAIQAMGGQPIKIALSPKTKPEPVKAAVRQILSEISLRTIST